MDLIYLFIFVNKLMLFLLSLFKGSDGSKD